MDLQLILRILFFWADLIQQELTEQKQSQSKKPNEKTANKQKAKIQLTKKTLHKTKPNPTNQPNQINQPKKNPKTHTTNKTQFSSLPFFFFLNLSKLKIRGVWEVLDVVKGREWS